MPYVEAAEANFEESGDGYPIILIHEFASDIRGWEAQLRHFSRDYRCVAYNARGYRRVCRDISLAQVNQAIANDDVVRLHHG
jgi:pimeloyl-ACP methyl ester carboxylesterase